MMENDPRRKGPRSPSVDSEDSSHRRRSRKYDRDRSPSPRRSRYRRSRSRERRSGSRERRRKESSRSQDWNKSSSQNPPQPNAIATGSTGYVPPVHNQYQQAPPPPNTSQPPPPLPPTYNQGYGNYNYNYNPQGYDYSYQQQAAGYRSDYPPQQNWPGGQVAYNNQQPPAAMPAQVEPARPVVEPAPPGLTPAAPRDDDTKKDAIANEVKQHKATLARQREEYVRKSTSLQNELEILREQCDEIGKDGRGDNNRFVKENQKLQIEIQNKMKKINNVIDMLTGIIGDKETVDELKIKFKREMVKKRSRSPKEEFPKPKLSDSPDKSAASDNEKEVKTEREKKISRMSVDENSKPLYNLVHYDPEMHWCKICDIFPKTAKEYLNHLHSNEHKETCLERKIVDMPWHPRSGGGTEKEVPSYPDLPTKRIPIKGLQFFSAATAWYCKLCDSWIGDLHCASLHLKSKRHSENFSSFVEQNPHWETDWMADREKAFSDERQKQMQLEMQKQKEGDVPLPAQSKPKKSKKSKKNKKKSKKRKNKNSNSESSSESENSDSDSDQDMSKSIRVAMRNKMKASTQAILNEEIDYHGIKLKGPWNQINKSSNSGNPPQVDDDRQLLNSLRDKLKARQEEEIKTNDRRPTIDHQVAVEEENGKNFSNKADPALEAWGPKEPPKPFWIKKDEEKPHSANKNIDIPKSDDIPKPHMGFWTKQPFNPPTKPLEKIEKEDERDRERDRYKDDRDRKYDRRDDKYHRYDNYDRRRRDRDRDYYDDRRKDRRNDDSPRRDRNYRESPKRNYDKYKDNRREDESNDESKFEKKTNESASKLKKVQMQTKKPPPPSNKSGKLPFIGRLPLFKKKTEEPKPLDKDITPLPYVQSKFEDTPKVPSDIINPPGVVHITKLATPVNLNNSIPIAAIQSAMKILVAPPPPVLNTSKATAPLTIINSQEVVDMEIEDQTDETIIEETIVDQTDKVNVSVNSSSHLAEKSSFSSAQSETTNSTVFSTTIPPPFLTSNPPPFVQNSTGFGPVPGTMPQFAHPPPMSAAFMQTHAPLPQMQQVEGQLSSDVSDHSEHPELPEPVKPSADPSQPLPEDLQEALNIIFPKDEVETTRKEPSENNAMYTTIYSGMLGCVEYGLEYMDQPPPEITQTEVDVDAQPGPDDLRMLGIDEGDTIL